MKFSLMTLGLVLLAAGCAAAQSQEKKAMSLRVRETSFDAPRIVTLKSMPPQFRVVLSREMPSAGWSFEVDAIDVDEGAKRIVARATATPPEGMAAQVLTATPLALEVGALAPGAYFLELWLREDHDEEHEPALAMIVTAD